MGAADWTSLCLCMRLDIRPRAEKHMALWDDRGLSRCVIHDGVKTENITRSAMITVPVLCWC